MLIYFFKYFCSKVAEHNKSQTSTHLAIWRLLSLSCLRSRKHFRCSASLSVSRLLELCFSICSKVVSWLELSMKCIRKVSSTAIDKHLSHNWGKYVVCMPWEFFCLLLIPGVSGCSIYFWLSLLMKGATHVNFLEINNPRCCIEDCIPVGCNTIVWVVGNILKGPTVFTFSGEAQGIASYPKTLGCLVALLWEFNGMMQIAWPSWLWMNFKLLSHSC